MVFYCDRLKDSAVITPHVLEGLLALVHLCIKIHVNNLLTQVHHQQLNNEDVVNISRTIFRETHNQVGMSCTGLHYHLATPIINDSLFSSQVVKLSILFSMHF